MSQLKYGRELEEVVTGKTLRDLAIDMTTRKEFCTQSFRLFNYSTQVLIF